MQESVIDLAQRVSEDVFIESNTIPPVRSIALWKSLDAQKKRWARILAHMGSPINKNGEIQWTSGFLQEYSRVKRSLWSRLRGIDLERVISGPKEEEFQASGERRSVTLCWTTEASQPIMPALSKEQSVLLNLGASLVILPDAPLGEVSISKNRTVYEDGEKILTAIVPFGSPVANIAPRRTHKRSIFCLKQFHGQHTLYQDFLDVPELATAFFRHQKNILDIQRCVANEVPLSSIHFFLEGWSDKAENNLVALKNLSQTTFCPEKLFEQATYDQAAALRIFEELRRATNLDPAIAQLMFQHFIGVNRFIKQLLLENKIYSKNVHGLNFEEMVHNFERVRRAGGDLNIVREMNLRIPGAIDQHVGEGEIGVIIIGGGHCAGGCDSYEKDHEDLLESVLSKSRVMDDTRLIVIEPHDYRQSSDLHQALVVRRILESFDGR